MNLLKADHERGIALDGVAGLVPRPVDIDQAQTGFTALRTLRIYRFAPPAVIDGHAEEDEVFIVVLSGSVDLVMQSVGWSGNGMVHTLHAPDDDDPMPCAAYLPPHAEYRLTPRGSADIAYARATPSDARPPAVFASAPRAHDAGICLLLDESRYAQRLRIKLLKIEAAQRAVTIRPAGYTQDAGETLLHVRTTPARGAAKTESEGVPTALESWDTVALRRGDTPTLHVAAGSSLLGFMVTAA